MTALVSLVWIVTLQRPKAESQEATLGWKESTSWGQFRAEKWSVAGPGGADVESVRFLDANGLQNPPLVVIKVAWEHYVAGLLSELAEEVREICLQINLIERIL